MAGNIPLVGFHDFLSVLITGNNLIAKTSSKDSELIIYISEYPLLYQSRHSKTKLNLLKIPLQILMLLLQPAVITVQDTLNTILVNILI